MSNARTVELGGETVEIQPITGRKALRATKLVRELSKAWPKIALAKLAFVREYEIENALELPRATARHQYRPRPLFERVTDEEGVKERPVLHEGDAVYGRDPLGHLTDADWEASGQMLKVPESPSEIEAWLGVFEQAMEVAEDLVVQVLALAVVDADVLKTAAHTGGAEAVTETLRKRGDELLDEGTIGELFELLIVTLEVCDQEVLQKLQGLGDRVGNALQAIGLRKAPIAQEEETSTTSSTSSKQTSSTDSPEPMAGASPERSTEPASAGSPSSAPG